MPDEGKAIKIRVRSGDSEAEIETSFDNIRDAIELIPEVLAKLPRTGAERTAPPIRQQAEAAGPGPSQPVPVTGTSAPSSMPIVTIEKGDSLSDVISKFFADPWGRSPRKLMEVREALQSYGLNYPKQSVAVALLRLAKGSRIRRFKGEGGEYVYTAATGAVRVPTSAQPAGVQLPAEGASPALEAEVDPEEQLDLDAPATN